MAIIVLVVVLTCLVVITSLALVVAHQDDTINDQRAALLNARRTAPALATAGPTVSGSAMFMLPDLAGGSFSVIAVAVRPKPGSALLTWLFVYGRHADPGERYGLISDTCGGQYVAAFDLAHGTADRNGDVTIVAPSLAINPLASDVWVQLYR